MPVRLVSAIVLNGAVQSVLLFLIHLAMAFALLNFRASLIQSDGFAWCLRTMPGVVVHVAAPSVAQAIKIGR